MSEAIWRVAQSVGFDDYELKPMLEAFASALSNPAPSPQAPGRRKGPPGITLEPQGHEQPAAPEWLNSAFPNCEDLQALGLKAPTPAQFAQQLHKRWKAKLEKVEEELCALKATHARPPAAPVVSDERLLREWDRVSHITEAGSRRLAFARAILALQPTKEAEKP